MPNPSPLHPDPMPLREALRGLRYVLRRGGETLRDTVSSEALPGPAGSLAHAVLREMAALAAQVDDVASEMARTVLGGTVLGGTVVGGTAPEAATLHDLGDHPGAEAQFAAAIYAALRAVLHHLGAPGVFVSEASARKVANLARAPGLTDARLAARMTLDLLAAKVIRTPTADEAAQVPGGALQPVAIFAVLLWLQSDRAEPDNEAALVAASDLAIALAGDVAKACADQNLDRIEALYAKYASHV